MCRNDTLERSVFVPCSAKMLGHASGHRSRRSAEFMHSVARQRAITDKRARKKVLGRENCDFHAGVRQRRKMENTAAKNEWNCLYRMRFASRMVHAGTVPWSMQIVNHSGPRNWLRRTERAFCSSCTGRANILQLDEQAYPPFAWNRPFRRYDLMDPERRRELLSWS